MRSHGPAAGGGTLPEPVLSARGRPSSRMGASNRELCQAQNLCNRNREG